MKRHSIQRSRKKEDFKGLRTTARRSTRHTPVYYFVVLSYTFSCFLDVSQESLKQMKTKNKKLFCLLKAFFCGGRFVRPRVPRLCPAATVRALRDAARDAGRPRWPTPSTTRSALRTIIIVVPPLAFRTYQILPHTNSYFSKTVQVTRAATVCTSKRHRVQLHRMERTKHRKEVRKRETEFAPTARSRLPGVLP